MLRSISESETVKKDAKSWSQIQQSGDTVKNENAAWSPSVQLGILFTAPLMKIGIGWVRARRVNAAMPIIDQRLQGAFVDHSIRWYTSLFPSFKSSLGPGINRKEPTRQMCPSQGPKFEGQMMSARVCHLCHGKKPKRWYYNYTYKNWW